MIERNNNSHCTSPEVFSGAHGEHALVRNDYKVGALAPGGNGGHLAGVNFHLRANVVERRHHHTWLICNSPDIAPVARARLRSAHSSPYCGQTPPGRSTYGRPALHFCSAGRSHFRSRRGMRGETSLSVVCSGASTWVRPYRLSAKSLNYRVSKVALQGAKTCTKFCRSNCSCERFGRKTEPRTTCGSLALHSARRSAALAGSTRQTMPRSPRSCAANTASTFCSTSWVMPDRNGSAALSVRGASVNCGGALPSNSASSRNSKWQSNRGAA